MFALLLVVAASGLAVAGLLVVRRNVSFSRLEGHDDVVGFIYSAVAVLYAVLAAFVLLAAWEEYSAAEANLAQEANHLQALHREAGLSDDGPRAALQRGVREYTAALVTDEWPAMRRGEQGLEAGAKLANLWRVMLAWEPRDAREERWQSRVLDRLDDVGGDRALRLLASRSRLPALVRAMLLGGALVAVGSTYLFGTRRVGKHAVMVAVLAGTLSLVLLVTFALDRPFSGPLALAPDALELARDEMDQWEASGLGVP